jgi:DNA polymerase I-like protein with 3'-5' exonuclease and polymerase domains
LSYGAVEQSGTADRAAHKVGAQRMVMDRLKEHTKLNQSMIDFANKNGYVETLPDKEIDPTRGYPLLCTRSKWGQILPTVPLNYHVQGSGCWIIARAMHKVREYFKSLRGYAIVMQIHDELVIEMPLNNKANPTVVGKVRRIMEQVGECVGIPLTCGVTRHTDNWSEGESL